MKALTCEMCGSTNLIKQDGVFVCQQCGTKYSVEEAKKMMIEGTVSVQGTVSVDNTTLLQNLYKLGRKAIMKQSEETLKYYKRIFEIDSESKEANMVIECFDVIDGELVWDSNKINTYIKDFSQDEKQLYWSILKSTYKCEKDKYRGTAITWGDDKVSASVWGECYVEFFTELALARLDYYILVLENCHVLGFGIDYINWSDELINLLHEINPLFDLQEYRDKFSSLISELHEKERKKKEKEREERERKEKEREREEKSRKRSGCVWPIILFLIGLCIIITTGNVIWGGLFVCSAIAIYFLYIIDVH